MSVTFARWKRLLALALGAAAALAGLQHYTSVFAFPAPIAAGQTLFAVDFAHGEAGLKFSGDGEHVPGCGAADGASGCRLRIHWAEAAPAYRAELVPVAVTGFYHGCYPQLGPTYEYSFRLFLPADWTVDDDTESVAQWHGAPDRLLLEGDLNPAMALNILGARYELDIRSDSRLVTSMKGGYESAQAIDLGDLRGDLGRWVDWRFRVQWSCRATDPGRVQVFRDGICLLDRAGPNCFRDLRGGPYWKVGLYKWSWVTKPHATPSVRERELRVDGLRIGVPTR
ncbi:MAG: polysaccharide lyase [Planctomycetota bacterium]